MRRFIRWLLRLLSFGNHELNEAPMPGARFPPKTIVSLLIYPKDGGGVSLNETTQASDAQYYVSAPWAVDTDRVNQAIISAELWLAGALGTRISWSPIQAINSQHGVSEWRSGQIYLIKDEVELIGLPWTDDYVYLAFVRGMGGYAGGIGYQDGNAGYAMVGDICLEAICDYPEPSAGSVLLGSNGWPATSYSSIGQTGAFIHEALHGLDLPHPDGWPKGNRPGWDETLMGNWWNMPHFANSKGLTQREIARVLEWVA